MFHKMMIFEISGNSVHGAKYKFKFSTNWIRENFSSTQAPGGREVTKWIARKLADSQILLALAIKSDTMNRRNGLFTRRSSGMWERMFIECQEPYPQNCLMSQFKNGKNSYNRTRWRYGFAIKSCGQENCLTRTWQYQIHQHPNHFHVQICHLDQ